MHDIVRKGGWNIADCVKRSYDIEGMNVGTVAAGRIGLGVLKRFQPFGLNLHYYDRSRLPLEVEQEYNLTFHEDIPSLCRACDIVSIHCPLYPETENLFDEAMLMNMEKRVLSY